MYSYFTLSHIFLCWVSILSFFNFLFLFWLGCIQYVFCAEFVSWFPILWPSAIFWLPLLFWPTGFQFLSFDFVTLFWFCLPILTRLDWELSDQWRQICIIAFYRKDLKPIKSWARTITWILLDLANIALAADEYATEDFHADSCKKNMNLVNGDRDDQPNFRIWHQHLYFSEETSKGLSGEISRNCVW